MENTEIIKNMSKNERNRLIGERIFGQFVQKKQDETVAKNPADEINQTIRRSMGTEPQGNEVSKLQAEIETLKSENFNVKAISALEKAGCLNAELAVKALPADCENINDWVEKFKTDNEYLFKKPQPNHSTSFKPSQCKTLSTNEIMNNFIRGIY